MKKSKKIFIYVVSVFVVIIFVILICLKLNKSTKLEILSNIKLSLGSNIPTASEFFKSKNVKGKVKIYYNDWLVESNTLDEEGTYKVVVTINGDEYTSTIEVTNDNKKEENVNNIDKVIEENVEENYKYGVKVTTTEKVYYAISENNEKKRIRSKNVSTYDKSTYSATTEELIKDATKLVESQKEKVTTTLESINKLRSEVGEKPLTLSKNLSIAATIRSLEIAWSGNFSHTRPNGNSCYDVYKDMGMDNTILGENILKGSYDEKSVVYGFKESLGYYKNMIEKNYTYIGIGVVEVDGEYYWTLFFTDEN